tara:strand:- start:302 stop:448 length:147 start_codon:yes stop_codon:yes gene_type:complete
MSRYSDLLGLFPKPEPAPEPVVEETVSEEVAVEEVPSEPEVVAEVEDV